MPKTLSAGNAGASRYIALNGNQGGGNKKQGLPSYTGNNANINYNRAYGNNRNIVFNVNQLGGIGKGRSMFSTSADGNKSPVNTKYAPVNTNSEVPFLWGASTSSYQIEGTKNGNRGNTIWDTFVELEPSVIKNDSNAYYACNSYNQYKDDVDCIKQFNGNSYRFSIAWSRIFTSGKGTVNKEGVEYYHNLIDECLKNNITPNVCLYHWDLPQALQDEYNGWLCENQEIVVDFRNYADFCFSEYGDKVKHWGTINEPQTIAIDSYEYNWYAPGAGNNTGNSVNGYEYTAAHNLLLSHAHAVDCYRTKYKHQNGKIGIICNMDWAEPYSSSIEDTEAAKRGNVFWGGWFWDPIFFGEYPILMQQLVGDRLPRFTKSESELVQGSIDILFLNSYSSYYLKHENENENVNNYVGWTYDQKTIKSFSNSEGTLIGIPSQSSWLHIVPYGIRNILLWIQNRYSYNGPGSGIGINKRLTSGNDGFKMKIPLIITEMGIDLLNQDQNTLYSVAQKDTERIYYYESYLQNIAYAVEISGIDFKGFFPWSLLDNFEWTNAYTCRFGLFYLDCNKDTNIIRRPKNSVQWYKNYIDNNPNGPSISLDFGFANKPD